MFCSWKCLVDTTKFYISPRRTSFIWFLVDNTWWKFGFYRHLWYVWPFWCHAKDGQAVENSTEKRTRTLQWFNGENKIWFTTGGYDRQNERKKHIFKDKRYIKNIKLSLLYNIVKFKWSRLRHSPWERLSRKRKFGCSNPSRYRAKSRKQVVTAPLLNARQ